jgi:HlyD family secretion protein
MAVKCIEARKGPFIASIKATGRLISRKSEIVKSLYAGIVRDNGFEDGAHVHQSAHIAFVVPPDEIRKKKEIDLDLAELDLALIKEQRLQAEELFNAKAASEREVNELKIRQRKQEALVENLREELSEKTIAAPFAGLFVEKRFHGGDRINAGTELFTLIDTRAAAVEAKVHQIDVPKIRSGQAVTLRSEIFRQPHAGSIKEISTVTARQNTSGYGESYSSFFTVYIQVDSLAPEELRIGASVDVEIVLSEKQDVISIPLECVRFDGPTDEEASEHVTFNPFVTYTIQRRPPRRTSAEARNEEPAFHRSIFINENGIARKRVITTGDANENFIEIVSGLKEGELIIAIGNAEISDGTKLRMQ